jgi:hypothetical protein
MFFFLQIVHRRQPAANAAAPSAPRTHEGQDLSRHDSFSSRRSTEGGDLRPREAASRGAMSIYELEDSAGEWQPESEVDEYAYADDAELDDDRGGGYAQWRQGSRVQPQAESVGDRLYHKAEELQRQRHAEVMYKIALSNSYDANGQPLFQVLYAAIYLIYTVCNTFIFSQK